MVLNIKSDEADRLARELAAATGETITTAVTRALDERLRGLRRAGDAGRAAELNAIFARSRALARETPRDGRSDDDILGYDDFGRW